MAAETLASLLGWGRSRLAEAGIDTSALDARLLLQHITGFDLGALIGRPETGVADDLVAQFRELIERRYRHEPVSRIMGVREFYGRNFRLSPATLDPRPDTETLISAALEEVGQSPAPHILDLGSGTGAIAITLLAELPGAQAVATDISQEALAVVASNARKHSVADRLKLVHASWYDGLKDCYDLIISNPPYLSSGEIETLEPDVREWDPRPALDGGPDGLACYREIAAGARNRLTPSGRVILEIGAEQSRQVTEIFTHSGLELRTAHRDLSGHMRCLVFGIRKMGVGNAPDLGYIPTR